MTGEIIEHQTWKLISANYDEASDSILLDFLLIDEKIKDNFTEVMPQPYTKRKLEKWKRQIGELFKANLIEEDSQSSVILEHIKTKEKVVFT